MSGIARGLGLLVVATAPAWVWNPYHLHTLIMAGIFAVLALSLNPVSYTHLTLPTNREV